MNHSETSSRGTLAFIAFINGVMGFVVSTLAVPAQSTALAAAGLNLLRDSVEAWVALWVSLGVFRRPEIITRIVGVIMILLGVGVAAIAVGRLAYGSTPDPATIAVVGTLALFTNLATIAVTRRRRLRAGGLTVQTDGFWKTSLNEAAGHIAVIATALIIALTGSNIPDIAVGAAVAGMFIRRGFATVMAA